MPESTAARWAPWVNLVLPGGGLILVGAVVAGLVVGVVFAVCANLVVAAVLLFPDDFKPVERMLVFGVAGGTYLGAQIRLVQAVRRHRRSAVQDERRRELCDAQELVSAGRMDEALARLRLLAERFPEDVHVAFRLAQLLTATGNKLAALSAWRRVRALDRHGIYRPLVVEHERQLDERAV